ncbi:nuclear transport factor 2 family protein [Sphingobium sp. EM0848]|uniref:nuclear transport factor 2 family protein n=1 Tax=Sphingobium sp. EM0848 TaxID=2743473 RepID=UPI00159C4610|nr:nuclear transport factor 2 family protein [Sphingobium sp. EM0848]
MDNKSIVQGFFAVMNEDGPEAAARQFGTPDMVWWTPGGGEIQGQLAALSALIDKHFDVQGITLTIEGVTAEGDRVAVEARSEGRLRNGSRYANRYHWLFLLRDGKITVAREYNDTAHVNAVLGPALAGAA